MLFSRILPAWQQKDGFLLNFPDRHNPKRVRELLQGTANLEFWETYENSEVIGYLSAANNLLKEINLNSKISEVKANEPAAATTPSDTSKKDQTLLDLIEKDTTKAAEASNT